MLDLRKIVASGQQQKQEYKEKKQAEREELNEMQDTAIQAFTNSPAAYHAYLELQAQNPAISVGNIALVWMQSQETTLVNTMEKWNRLGRSVQRGAIGVKIIMPEKYKDDNGYTRTGYKIGRAFDVSQTYGTRLPPPLQLQEDTPQMEKAIVALVSSSPAPVVPMEGFESGAFYNPDGRQILIQTGMSDGETFAALAREIAHARYHIDAFGSYYVREDAAIDAESVSYLLCRRFGVPAELPSASGVGEHYAEQDTSARRSGLEYMRDLSEHMGRRILRELNPPQREHPEPEPEK